MTINQEDINKFVENCKEVCPNFKPMPFSSMHRIWIIWRSSGSYDDYHKSIHKVYADESLANAECEKLNQGLKDEMKRLNKIMENVYCTCETLADDEECEYHEAEWSRYNLQEQWDYVVEGFEVEGK